MKFKPGDVISSRHRTLPEGRFLTKLILSVNHVEMKVAEPFSGGLILTYGRLYLEGNYTLFSDIFRKGYTEKGDT